MTESLQEALPLAPAALAGKSCSEPEIIRWVARNIDNPEAGPDDCPDPFAWTLLKQCRSDPEFVTFFIEKLWVKLLPTGANRDRNDTGGALDGRVTLDILERIMSIRDKVETPRDGAVG